MPFQKNSANTANITTNHLIDIEIHLKNTPTNFCHFKITPTNDAFALVGIKTIDPEITGCDTMDLNLEVPMGETTAKVSLKISSTVASSILAQEKFNQIARDNIHICF